jgi:hypothetical protein
MSAQQFNLKAVFSLIDKITAPLKGINNTAASTTKAFGNVGGAAGSASQKLDGVTRAARNTSLSFQFVEQAAEKVTPAVTTMSERIGAAQKVLEKFGLTADRMRKSGGGHGGLFGLGAGFLGAFGAYELGKDFIHINATLEGFRSSLETTMGGPKQADAAMAWVSKFERKSPYSYEQVAETFTTLQAYGMNPMGGSLEAVANASGAMHKQLWQGALAMVDAVNGMYRELKLFGIHAKDDGDQVRLTWKDPKTSKWHAGFAQKGTDQVGALVVTAFNQIGGGGMARMARTWDGLMSNLESAWWRFNKMVADSGVWKAMKGDLMNLSDWLANTANDKVLQGWADKIAGAAVKIYFAIRDLVTKIDWIKLIGDIADLVSGFTNLIDKVGGFGTVIKGFIAGWIFFKTIGIGITIANVVTAIIEATAAAEGIIPVIIAAGAAFLGLDVAMGPIGLIILAVAALAAGAFLLITNWDKVSKWFMDFLKFMSTSPFVPDWIRQLSAAAIDIATHWDKVTKAFKDFGTTATGVWNGFPKPLRDFLLAMENVNIGSFNMDAANLGAKAGLAVRQSLGLPVAPIGSAQNAPVKGTIRADIHVHGPATVKGVQSSGNVDTHVHQVLNGFQGAK